MSEKTVPGILRFVSMLFLIFEKGDVQENSVRYFEIRMLFLILQKGDEQKNCARYFEIRKYAFFNI